MIRVTFLHRQGRLAGFTCTGHAGLCRSGQRHRMQRGLRAHADGGARACGGGTHTGGVFRPGGRVPALRGRHGCDRRAAQRRGAAAGYAGGRAARRGRIVSRLPQIYRQGGVTHVPDEPSALCPQKGRRLLAQRPRQREQAPRAQARGRASSSSRATSSFASAARISTRAITSASARTTRSLPRSTAWSALRPSIPAGSRSACTPRRRASKRTANEQTLRSGPFGPLLFARRFAALSMAMRAGRDVLPPPARPRRAAGPVKSAGKIDKTGRRCYSHLEITEGSPCD